MKAFAISFWLWLPAVMRASLFSVSAMIAAFLANVNGKTSADIANWGKLEWAVLFLTVAGAGITPVIAFLDQSMTFIRNKFGDTQFITRNTGP